MLQKTTRMLMPTEQKGMPGGADNVVLFRSPVAPLSARGVSDADGVNGQIPSGELWSAIHDDRVEVHYQPQYELNSGRTTAVEALVRLTDRDGYLIYPDRFIAEAERTTLIVDLGRRVIAQVCEDLAGWRRRGLLIARAAINLSAPQLSIDEKLADYVIRTTRLYGLMPDDLEFELTEQRHLDPDSVGMDTLTHLCAAGSRLALDDFGAGYSSLAYLTGMQVNTLKLDRRLIQRVPAENTSSKVIRNALALAADLGMDVVAEGIETEAQHTYMAGTSCRLGQGYLYARPMAAQDIAERVSSRQIGIL